MKSFYVAGGRTPAHVHEYGPGGAVVRLSSAGATGSADASRAESTGQAGPSRAAAAASCARIAVYDGVASAPRVEEVRARSAGDLIEDLSARAYECARAMGGAVPYSVVREIVENLIHAQFREPVISILDRGNTIRFSDQGPGFSDIDRALEPGYTTATHDMKQFIRGVGSGLPLVREALGFRGGSLRIEGNLGKGAVVTVAVPSQGDPPIAPGVTPAQGAPSTASGFGGTPGLTEALPLQENSGPVASSDEAPQRPARLTSRQKQVLALVMETGAAGPSIVAKELSVGLSTAYRDLAHLESLGLIESDETGKRALTDEGSSYLSGLLTGLY